MGASDAANAGGSEPASAATTTGSKRQSLPPSPTPPTPGLLPKLSQLLERNAFISTPRDVTNDRLPMLFPDHTTPPPLTLAEKQSVTVHDRKRSFDEVQEDEHSANPCESSPSRKRHSKWRKPTYLVRKEEKKELLDEIKQLQDQIAFLQRRTGVDEWQVKDRQLIEKEISNHELRNSVRYQHFQVLAAKSAVCELTTKMHEECPIDTFIHLGLEWPRRIEALMALKEPQMRQAIELLERRTQFTSEPRECVESAQFVSDGGDFCSIRFDVTPLDGLTTVKDAFEFVHFYIRHMKSRAASESLTKLASSDRANEDASILQRRLIMSSIDDIATEANFVMFSELRPSSRGHCAKKRNVSPASDIGLLVINFVDEDDLYPYNPSQFIQHDLTGVMAIESCKKRVKTASGAIKEETVIVLTRWVLQKLRHTELKSPSHVMQTMRDRINEPGNAILQAVKEARHPFHLEPGALSLVW